MRILILFRFSVVTRCLTTTIDHDLFTSSTQTHTQGTTYLLAWHWVWPNHSFTNEINWILCCNTHNWVLSGRCCWFICSQNEFICGDQLRNQLCQCSRLNFNSNWIRYCILTNRILLKNPFIKSPSPPMTMNWSIFLELEMNERSLASIKMLWYDVSDSPPIFAGILFPSEEFIF